MMVGISFRFAPRPLSNTSVDLASSYFANFQDGTDWNAGIPSKLQQQCVMCSNNVCLLHSRTKLKTFRVLQVPHSWNDLTDMLVSLNRAALAHASIKLHDFYPKTTIIPHGELSMHNVTMMELSIPGDLAPLPPKCQCENFQIQFSVWAPLRRPSITTSWSTLQCWCWTVNMLTVIENCFLWAYCSIFTV